MLTKSKIRKINLLNSKKGRQEVKMFVAEGFKVVQELISEGLVLEIFYTSKYLDFFSSHKENFNEFSSSLISESEFKKISSLINNNGVLAICKQKDSIFDQRKFLNSFSIYLDDISDPGNLGTILRVADWFNIENVFCSLNSVDCYNSKVIQSSMGSIARVNVNYLTFNQLLTFIRSSGDDSFKIFVSSLSKNSRSIYDLETQKNGLLVVGNESHGVSEEIIKLADSLISIPRHFSSKTESLNAALATSILLSEFFRRNR